MGRTQSDVLATISSSGSLPRGWRRWGTGGKFDIRAGRSHARVPGYRDGGFEGIVDGAVKSFERTGNPFAGGRLQALKRQVDLRLQAPINVATDQLAGGSWNRGGQFQKRHKYRRYGRVTLYVAATSFFGPEVFL